MSTAAQARLWTKDFTLGTAVNFLLMVNYYGLMVVVADYAMKTYDAPAATAGLAASIFIIGALAARLVSGRIMDKVGRKRNLAFSWLFCIVAIVLCSIFVAPNNMGLCIALMLLFGFALNYAITAVQPLMPESYPTAIRNTGTSWCQAFARFGGSASSIVLGGIAGMAFFQTATGATNWSTVVPWASSAPCCS